MSGAELSGTGLGGTELGGTELAAGLRARVAERVTALAAAGCRPRVVVVTATADPAGAWYVDSVVRACTRVGIDADVTALGADAAADRIRATLAELSAAPDVSGIILATPLPPGVTVPDVAECIAVGKDLDGANPLSLGRLVAGLPAFAPATAEAVVRLLDHHGIDVRGREVVVVGRSLVVGRPLAHLLLRRDATVTIAHSVTRDLPGVTARADVVVAAVGRAGLIGPGHVQRGAVVVDVGTNVTAGGTLAGDVDPAVAQVAAALSPVPGGVGPVTTAVLLEHAVEAARGLAVPAGGPAGQE